MRIGLVINNMRVTLCSLLLKTLQGLRRSLDNVFEVDNKPFEPQTGFPDYVKRLAEMANPDGGTTWRIMKSQMVSQRYYLLCEVH